MKKVKEVLAVVLVFAMLLSTVAYAAPPKANSPGVVVTESSGVRTAISSDDTAEYTVVYDQINETVSITVRNLQTGEINSTMVEGQETVASIMVLAGTIDQDTETGYRYTVYTGATNEWCLVRPKVNGEGEGKYYFKCWENSSNETELEDFKVAVNSLAAKEGEMRSHANSATATLVISAILATIAMVGSAGVLTGAAIAALVSGIGLTGTAKAAAEAVAVQANDCFYAIEAVYYATDNIHF